jgi:hypothetical protein
MKDLKALMGKKDEGDDSMKKDAKLSVLKNLRKMASDMMGEDLKGGMDMKKVTVAAPDDHSLKLGLEKAKSVVGDMPDESNEDESTESPDDDIEEGEPTTPEEVDKKIAELQALKAHLLSKS